MTARPPLRAAVVGVGSIGALHARIYRSHPQAKLVAVMDADRQRARRVGEELGVPWFGELDDMLDRQAIDVVSIATPEDARLTPARACAQAGKALLLEKPLAPTLEETDQLIEAIEASGVLASVNYLLRADLRFLSAREAIGRGDIGDICALNVRRRGSSESAARYGAWTDLVISTAVHDLDAMTWLGATTVERVHAEGSRRAGGPTEDVVAALLRFTNGAVGLLESSWVVPPSLPAPIDTSFHVLGTRGAIFIDGANHGLVILDEHRVAAPDLAHWPSGPWGVGGALDASIDRFLQSVTESGSSPVPLAEARQVEALAAAIKRSLRTGEPVLLPGRAAEAAPQA